MERGLAVIGSRAESLNRFMSAYATLAKLPPPKRQRMDVGAWVRRVLIASYREFEARVGSLSSARGAKTQLVLDVIRSLPDGFRMVEVERSCPNVTRDMIRVVINKLKKQGELQCEGAGADAVWRKRGNNS
jgi:hypothetical protein